MPERESRSSAAYRSVTLLARGSRPGEAASGRRSFSACCLDAAGIIAGDDDRQRRDFQRNFDWRGILK